MRTSARATWASNPDDPMDTPLLRFTVSRFDGDDALLAHALNRGVALLSNDGAGWQWVDDASYCTQLPASLSERNTAAALILLMGWFHDEVEAGRSIKKMAEIASWIEPAWLDKPPGTILFEGDPHYPSLTIPQDAPWENEAYREAQREMWGKVRDYPEN